MVMLAQTWPGVLGDAGLSSSVAVAAAALVVVLTIVLVFVMVLRSNGAARRTASGLGYDSRMGPLGQPQNPQADDDWRGAQSGGGWGGQMGAEAVGRPQSGGWGQDFGAGAGQPGGAQGAGSWGGQAGPGWDDQSARGAPAGWGAGGAPWDDQGAGA